MGRMMILVFIFLMLECDKDSTSIDQDKSKIKFKLSADKIEGNAPLTIKFTGTLTGNIDTLKLCNGCPYSFCKSNPHTCILYCSSCDTPISAQTEYFYEYTYDDSGTYRPYMWLNLFGLKNRIYSDTLIVTVK